MVGSLLHIIKRGGVVTMLIRLNNEFAGFYYSRPDKLKIVEDMSYSLHKGRKWVLVKLPIIYIALPNPWSPSRFNENMGLISRTWALPPVIAFYEDTSGLFSLNDGIHRTNVVKALGYDYVPAMIPRRDYDKFELDKYEPYVKARHIGSGIYA